MFPAPLLRRIAAFILLCGGMPVSAQTNKPFVVRDPQTNIPNSILFAEGQRPDGSQSQAILKEHLELRTGSDSFSVKRTTQTPLAQFVKLQQYYQGYPVENGVFNVLVKDGKIAYINGNFHRPAYSETATTALTESAALSSALAEVGAEKYMWQDAGMERLLRKSTRNPDTSYYPKGQLMWYGGDHDGKLHLVYKFTVFAAQPIGTEEVFVDANTGSVLFKNPLLHHVAATAGSLYSGTVSIETLSYGSYYTLEDMTRGNGVLTGTLNNTTNTSLLADVTNTSTSWPASVGIDAHWGAEKVYDFWLQKMNRSSYDDYNTALVSVVNYDVAYENAFWNGVAMFYGDGSGIANGGHRPFAALDVCAHEIGHGVTQETCNLYYNAESGALNEGFSDIWGATIEDFANPNEVDSVAKSMWLMGEEIGATPMRSMANPKIFGDPDTYNGQYWVPISGCNSNNDYCGVHTNSGVLNHWFYLLTMGGIGVNDLNNAYAVAGVGIDTASQLAYFMELSLYSTADFSVARSTAISIAQSLYGNCHYVTEAVTRAWYAVGVGPDFMPCTPQISFTTPQVDVSEFATGNSCSANKVINIPIKLAGPTLTGGNATATINVTNTNALAGIDYDLTTSSVTFPVGSANTTQDAAIKIYDNGSIGVDKTIEMSLVITANGSNATLANTIATSKIVIADNERKPEIGSTVTNTVSGGMAAAVNNNNTSPFQSGYRAARMQYLLTPDELLAGGVVPNAPITGLSFEIVQKNSTQPFNGYTVRMGHTTLNTLGTSFANVSTQLYSGNYSTLLGWNNIYFTNNFVWDGTSNVVVEICFTNTSTSTANDITTGYIGNNYPFAMNRTTSSSPGCTLSFNSSLINTAKPVMKFTQSIPPTPVESSLATSKSWGIRMNDSVFYFSAADSELIAAIIAPNTDLGCTMAEVSQQGSGFVPAAYGIGNRSVKEFKLTPLNSSSNVSYTGIFYFNLSEMVGLSLNNAGILRTTAATDAAINSANSEVVPATRINGAGYVGFKGVFSGGFSRFFVTDIDFPLAIADASKQEDAFWINNPVTDKVTVHYAVDASVPATIKLYDLSGRLLYTQNAVLAAGANQLEVGINQLSLPIGQYYLQVVSADKVYNKKLLKL